VAHDLIGKPASTFPDHAQAAASQEAWPEAGRGCSDISRKTPSVERRQASAPAAEGRRKPIQPWRAPHPLVRTVKSASVGVPLPSFSFVVSISVGWVERSETHRSMRKGDGFRCAQPILRFHVSLPAYRGRSAHASLFDIRIRRLANSKTWANARRVGMRHSFSMPRSSQRQAKIIRPATAEIPASSKKNC
jgi:hypothetical protein